MRESGKSYALPLFYTQRRSRPTPGRDMSLASTADVSGVSSLVPDYMDRRNVELEDLSRAISSAANLVSSKLERMRSRSGQVSEEGSASPVPTIHTHQKKEVDLRPVWRRAEVEDLEEQ